MRTLKNVAVTRIVLFFSAFVLFGVVGFHGISRAEESKPREKVGGTGNSSGAGTVTPDLFTGTMSSSVPIEVPEGRRGMSPGLSLDYKSNNGNGWVGVGWELEVGSIERSMKGGVNYSGDQYILRISGGTMDLVNIGSNEYRAKIEGGFYRITKLSGSNGIYWEVKDKGGMRYRYGQTAASRQDDPGDPARGMNSDPNRIFKWCLDRVEDAHGNYMTFSYTKAPFNNQYENHGQIYLDRIDYAGNDTASPNQPTTNYVKFYLESRTDAPDMFTTDFRVKTTYRLRTIEVRANGYPVRAYALIYDADPNAAGSQYSTGTGRSLLYSVKQFGRDASVDSTNGTVTGGSSLPPVTFAYTSGGTGFDAGLQGPRVYVTSTFQDASIDLSRVQMGDFNGDGLMDIAIINGWGTSENTSIYLARTDGSFSSTPSFQGPPYGVALSGSVELDLSRVSLGDFNGDGKTDIAVNKSWGSTEPMSIYLSTGNGFGPAMAGPPMSVSGTVSAGKVDISRVKLGDFNGDGRTDIARVNLPGTGQAMSIYLANPDGSFNGTPIQGSPMWSTDGDGTIEGDAVNIPRVLLGDFNGDGRTDIAHINGWGAKENTSIYLAKTDGSFSSTPDFQGPPSGVAQSGSVALDISRVSLGDFNGDGKTDIAVNNSWGSSAPMSIYLSTGNGFGPAIAGPSVWVYGTISAGKVDLSRVKFGDFNGDGRTDIARINLPGTGQTMSIYLAKDGSFSNTPIQGVPMWSAVGNGTVEFDAVNIPRVLLADFNGDGMTDIAHINGWGTTEPLSIFHAAGSFPDLVNTISNGLGGKTTVAYEPSTKHQNTQLPVPIQTVSSITNCNNFNKTTLTCDGITANTFYAYSGGYYHIGARDFRGFNYVKVTGPAGPNGEQAITETWFHQGNTTDVNDADPAATNDDPTGAVGYMKGKTYFTRVTDGAGHELSRSMIRYALVSTGSDSVYFYPPNDVQAYSCDHGSCGVRTRSRYEYDAQGNVTKESFYTDINGSTPYRTVIREYSAITERFLGLPIKETVLDGTDGDRVVSETTTYYDGVDDCTEISSSQIPTRGNVTRIVRLLDGTNDPEARMGYDAYGNLTCTRDARDNISRLAYDTSFTFPALATTPSVSGFPSGMTTTTTYYGVDGVPADQGLYGQVKSVTDPNGAVTTTVYDTFGRKTKITLPHNGVETWAYNSFGTVGAQNIKQDNSASLTSWTYFDGFGRTTLSKKDGPNGTYIAQQTQYNATGTVAQSSLPYFEGTETPRWTAYKYDALGRTIEVTNPDGTTSTACYDSLVTVGIDIDGHRKRTTKDVLGRLVKVEEYEGTYDSCTTDAGTSYAETNYTYDVKGNILSIRDAAGNTTEMFYDPLGRKVSMKDPDMGAWSYEYDANGNLVKQTDAKKQIVRFSYDEFNRITLKSGPAGTEVTYVYDVIPDATTTVTYPIGRLSSMTDKSGTTKYFYNLMGWLTTTKKFIGTAGYATVVSYDSAKRITVIYYPKDSTYVRYRYDAGNNLLSVAGGLTTGPTTTYATYSGYNALGQAGAVAYGNGVGTLYQHDDKNNRIKEILTSGPTGSILMKLAYEYDVAGRISSNITSVTDATDPARSATYEYDGLNRLLQAQSQAYGTQAYVYDRIGNIIRKPMEGTSMDCPPGTTLSGGQCVTISYGQWQSGYCDYYLDNTTSCWSTVADTCDANTAGDYTCSAFAAKTCNDVANYSEFGFDGETSWNYRSVTCNPLTSAAACPAGTSLNAAADRCEAVPACPAGSYDAGLDMCIASAFYAPGCPGGTVVNPSTDLCERPLGCPAGFELVGTECVLYGSWQEMGCDPYIRYCNISDSCNQDGANAYTCPAGSVKTCTDVANFYFDDFIEFYFWSQRTVSCIPLTNASTCPAGTMLNTALNLCFAQPVCPPGSTYDRNQDVCIPPATNIAAACPPGTALNGATDRCESAPICMAGMSYDPAKDVCSSDNVYRYSATRPHAVVSTPDGRTYTYDDNGNMISDGVRIITYNVDNMPVSVTVSGVTTTLVYDGGGARVKKISPSSGTTVYIGKFQEWRAGVNTNYIFAGGTRIAAKSGTEVFYYHQDHLGSTRVVTDQNGQQVENTAYYPFGATQSDTGGVYVNHKYTSQEFDPETGLYYYNARYYNPVLGRFISADTLVPNPADPQALNRYSYVRNNPLIYIDPSGHSFGKWWDHQRERLKRPQNAMMLQLLCPLAGTYYLSRTEQGRNILTGEILAVTAGATIACGGCGVAAGALIGEVVGGYSAYSNGGDVLNGVAVGGILGGGSAYLAGPINTEVGTFWEQAGNNFAAGAIRGGAIGLARGYQGGNGTLRTMYRGLVYGAAISGSLGASKVLMLGRNITDQAAVQDSLNHAKDAYGMDFDNVTVREGGLLSHLNGAHRAITLGNLVNMDAGLTQSQIFNYMGEELFHSYQYQVLGTGGFLSSYIGSWISNGFDYNKIWLEIEAKAITPIFW